ncbi:quinone oxidoreductase family protein [Mucilaginibacter sp. KACC 22063]|uniref:quinone oxidoreductase family protein n=1 Tax=Mucilaginibacter sp. KACC 22063 TaxID=3025666 RepID=UPI00236555FF|nr:zinc-binding alcohol dehydrogenase family protein [Mucilaginibacter sp. KACC 22063]WDF55520.1 zinc-binding alcohol dehydrogenase family protein [Mucilaginibacter sp. KACC 22063]
MKAAVIYQKGEMPQYVDFSEPAPKNNDALLVTVKAVAIKHLDKSKASGKHYSSNELPGTGRIAGGDGVCLLPNGIRVYGMAINGMLAEKALIYKDRIVKIPDGLDDATAAALPNAVIGAAMGLKFKADIQPGDTVLINGATGFTGRVAVQIAKYYGAGKVIATGRNQQSLNQLLLLGADEIITLNEDNDQFESALTGIHQKAPIDVVIDYLWGSTAEVILSILKGNGSFTNKIRYVSVGAMSGEFIQLSASNLRSADLQLTGSGLGAWTKQQVNGLFKTILPEMFGLAAEGRLKVETELVRLENITDLWNMEVPDGKRLVVIV